MRSLSGANLDRRWTATSKREIVESRIDTTNLLAHTLAELEPPPVLLVCGGVGIYGDRGDEILTEESTRGRVSSPTSGWPGRRPRSQRAQPGSGSSTSARASCLARSGGALKRMLTPFKLGLGGRVGSGQQWWSWVTRDDVVAAYLLALESDLSGAVNLVSPNPATSARFTKALGRALHRPTVLPAPAFAIKTVFGEKGEAVLLEGQRVLPARLLDAGFSFSYADLDGALVHALAE